MWDNSFGNLLERYHLSHLLEKEVLRRVRCPHCGALQEKDRRSLRQRNVHHTLVGWVSIGGSILGSLFLIALGYFLAGGWGLVGGVALAIWLVIRLTQWMLVNLL